MLSISDSTFKERYHLIDALRGLSIILMLAHHFGYTLLYFGFNMENTLASPIIGFLSPLFAGIFILLSGMSSRFSRSNIKRGIMTLVFAAILTFVSSFFDVYIWFGILHFLGLSMLTYGLISKFIDKIPFWPSLFLWSVLFIVGFIKLPALADNNLFLWFGLYKPGNVSQADYFPFGKWFFLFLAGTRIGQLVKEHKFPKWFYNFNMPFLPFVGRHTLIIYLAHQPVFYLILTIYTAVRS